MPFAPQITMPASRAIAAIRCGSGVTPSSGASYRLEKMTADFAPASTAYRSCSSCRPVATPRITRSGDDGRSASDGKHVRSNISSYFGLTG